MPLPRRRFLAQSAGLAALSAPRSLAGTPLPREPGTRWKLGVNAYSFDKPLRAGTMTLLDAVHFCARHNVDALDPTAYYFPNYPGVPPSAFVYDLKRAAFLNGVSLSGTGVRNDFATADPAARARGVDPAARAGGVGLVKRWIPIASQLGVPVLRVFSGPELPANRSFEEAFAAMVPLFEECASFGKDHGVTVAIQPHNDFLKTAAQTIRLIRAVRSDWFACILDIGSLRQGDPYQEIETLLPYAVSWQIKESVWRNGREEPVDLARLKTILNRSNYRGYLPFEALGAADPAQAVAAFLKRIRAALAV